jgi:hypothetical protein
LQNYIEIAVAAGAIEKALNLSTQPCALLAWLLEATDYFERQGRLSPYGVLWKSYPVSRSGRGDNDSRSVSRALQRLEVRGLVIRMDYRTGLIRHQASDPAPAVTTSVNLTPIGRKVAALIRAEKPSPLPGR